MACPAQHQGMDQIHGSRPSQTVSFALANWMGPPIRGARRSESDTRLSSRPAHDWIHQTMFGTPRSFPGPFQGSSKRD